jgi:2-dehydro-3-deoxygluconokinase
MSAAIVGLGGTLGLVTVEGIGRLRSGARAQVGFGGAETNVLVGAARLGMAGAWIGAVGEDAIGHSILEGLAAEGIDVSAVVRRGHAPTAAMLKYRRRVDDLHVDYLRAGSAFASLSADEIPESIVAGARILHTTGITAGLGDAPLAALRRAVEIAESADTRVSFDVNHRYKVWCDRDPRPVLRELVARADIVLASVAEAALITDSPPDDVPEVARSLARLGPRHVVIKQGAAGATLAVNDEIHRCAARHVPVHDPVGAGDALAAGVLVGLLTELPAPEALQLGVDLGTYAVTVDGDHDGAPSWTDLAAFREATGEPDR